MEVLVLNGSPRGEKSNTLCLTRAFLAGMNKATPIQTEILPVCKMDIRPCLGCFACWQVTPGVCCHKDQMASVLEKMLAADVIIWSFPLYYFGLPGGIKNLMDRQLPLNLPYMVPRQDGGDTGAHPARYDRSAQRTVLISTCGFYTAEGNYDAVRRQFDLANGVGGHTDIFCGQGPLFQVEQARYYTEPYLTMVERAGEEFAQGGIASETKERLRQLILPQRGI